MSDMPPLVTGATVADRAPAVWPALLVPAQQTITPEASSTRYAVAFTGHMQAATIGDGSGARYLIQASFAGLDLAEMRSFSAFVAGLRGQSRRFIFPLYPGMTPEPPVLGAMRLIALRRSLTTETASPDRVYCTAVLGVTSFTAGPCEDEAGGALALGEVLVERGAWLSFDDEMGYRRLCVATADVKVDSLVDGHTYCTVHIESPIARELAVGVAIDFKNPGVTVVLASDTEGKVSRTTSGYYDVSLAMVQVRSRARPNPLALPETLLWVD